MGSQLVVAVDDGIELVLHLLNVQGIQQNDLLSSAIGLDSEGSLSDVRWENHIVQNLLVHVSQVSGTRSHLGWVALGTWSNDGSVGNNNNWLASVSLKSILNDSTSLLEGAVRSVGNSNQKVLVSGAVSLLVVNHLGGVQEDDLKVLVEGSMLGRKRVEDLGNFLLELGWLFTLRLDDFVSFMEHVCRLAYCLFVC